MVKGQGGAGVVSSSHVIAVYIRFGTSLWRRLVAQRLISTPANR
jgi:hypothetical protein